MQNVSKTLHVAARLVGLDLPPADDVEAAAIAEPAGRMLARHIKLQNTIRKWSDPVVLVGALAAFVGARSIFRRAPSAPAPMRPQGTSATATATAHAAAPRPAEFAAPAAVPPAAAAVPPADEAALRDSIMASIANNGFGVH